MTRLILMRHGQSLWNLKNLFTGWVDVPLSEQGIEEALKAGQAIQDMPIDCIYTSTLIRAQMTAMLAVLHHHSKKVPVIFHTDGKMKEWGKVSGDVINESCIPVFCAWELNERMYGELQGLNKAELMKKYGEDQVKIWRRSYATCPPGGESLKLTAERSIPYFEEKIVPQIREGKNILVSAHGNSLRSIIMKLDGLSKEEVVKLELGTGVPICYTFQNDKFIKDSM